MAESIYSVVVEKVLEKLGSFVYQEISSVWGVQNDLKKLQETLTSVKAVLLDAEEKQVQSHQLRDWPQKVTDACYDTEDVLDEFEIEVLRRQVLKRQSIGRKVRNFVSSSNPLAFRFRMSHKMKEIRDKFDEIAAIKAKFHLTERDDNRLVVNRGREVTHSFVRASDVIGRDKDKEEILKLVLSPSDGHENVSVIPIVGIGGLGKTTLAKLVYNDQRVDQRFELKIWVCVSDEFFIKKLMVDMIESATGQNHSNMNIDQLQRILRDTLRDKQYLIVMDDVWNEDSELWIELKNLLLECGNGSKIIVTTRSDRVASIVGTVPTYNLGGLSLEESLSLLVKCAFREGEGKQLPNLIKIAEEIVKKCGGVPLAVRALGSLLYSSTYERDWENVRDNEIWKLEQKDNGILHALRISYNHLPSYLKQCFVYCSIYPKDSEFYSFDLVHFWMAHGLLQSPDENQDLENIGIQYLKELMSRSFFQDIEQFYDTFYKFKLHDLMHDLATSLMRNECLIVKSNNQFCSKTVRHLSFDVDDPPKIDVPNHLSGLGNLRSICFPIYDIGPSQSFFELIISRFQFLRLLDLDYSNIQVVPQKIGNLKHLRYLDLSRNPKLKKLPNSIYKLQSLQKLSLWKCEELEVLTGDVKYLISLRQLWLTTTQICLPKNGIGCLNSLRNLFLYGCHNLEYLFEDIGRLRFLRMLCILKCPRLISLPCGMKNLSSLEYLELVDCESLTLNLSMGSEGQDNQDEDLNTKRPHLQKLVIEKLTLMVEFPQWLLQGSVNTLRSLYIADCSNLKALPESIQNLQVLHIENCPELSSLPKDMNSLTTLRELKIEYCPKLSERCKPETGEDWWKITRIPKIEVDREIIKSSKNWVRRLNQTKVKPMQLKDICCNRTYFTGFMEMEVQSNGAVS